MSVETEYNHKAQLKQKMLSGVIWQTLERFGLQGFTFLLQLVLARLLLPKDFGVVVLLDVFIQVSWCFVDSGLGASMIQCREATERDFSGVYWLNQGIALLFYAGLFFLSPFIAEFYKIDQLAPMLQVGALNLFLVAHCSVCTAIVNRKLQFKKIFFIGFPATVLGGLGGVLLAFLGYGAWSLIWMQLLTGVFRLGLGIYQTHWMPGFRFNVAMTWKMFLLGYNLLIINIMGTLCNNMPSFVIGRLFPAAELGFYAKARKIPFFFSQGLRAAVTGTVFPALSAEQSNLALQRAIVSKAIIACNFLLFPVLAFLIGATQSIVYVMLGKNWLPIIPYVRIMALSFCFFAFQGINKEVLIANGKGNIFLKIEGVNTFSLVILFMCGIFFGIRGILWSMVVSALVAFTLYAYGCRCILGLGFFPQLNLTKKYALFSAIMGACVYGIENFHLNAFLLLVLDVIAGGVVYLLLSFVFNREQSVVLLKMWGPLFNKLRKGKTVAD